MLRDADYEMEDARHESVVVMLTRKEIENFLLDEALLARAAKIAAGHRTTQTGEAIVAPTEADFASLLDRIAEGYKKQVKHQLLWRYRDRLPADRDASTKEDQAEKWFEERWNERQWRLARIPGKKSLQQVRDWCKKESKLTLTSALLAESITHVPNDLQECLKRVAYVLFPPVTVLKESWREESAGPDAGGRASPVT